MGIAKFFLCCIPCIRNKGKKTKNGKPLAEIVPTPIDMKDCNIDDKETCFGSNGFFVDKELDYMAHSNDGETDKLNLKRNHESELNVEPGLDLPDVLNSYLVLTNTHQELLENSSTTADSLDMDFGFTSGRTSICHVLDSPSHNIVDEDITNIIYESNSSFNLEDTLKKKTELSIILSESIDCIENEEVASNTSFIQPSVHVENQKYSFQVGMDAFICESEADETTSYLLDSAMAEDSEIVMFDMKNFLEIEKTDVSLSSSISNRGIVDMISLNPQSWEPVNINVLASGNQTLNNPLESMEVVGLLISEILQLIENKIDPSTTSFTSLEDSRKVFNSNKKSVSFNLDVTTIFFEPDSESESDDECEYEYDSESEFVDKCEYEYDSKSDSNDEGEYVYDFDLDDLYDGAETVEKLEGSEELKNMNLVFESSSEHLFERRPSLKDRLSSLSQIYEDDSQIPETSQIFFCSTPKSDVARTGTCQVDVSPIDSSCTGLSSKFRTSMSRLSERYSSFDENC